MLLKVINCCANKLTKIGVIKTLKIEKIKIKGTIIIIKLYDISMLLYPITFKILIKSQLSRTKILVIKVIIVNDKTILQIAKNQ